MTEPSNHASSPAPSEVPADPLAVIIRNPRARRAVDAARLRDAAAPLRAAGWRVEIVDTTARAHATAIARDASAGGAAAVVACGGDGTIGEAAHALAGTSTALAAVPAGTANVWAREARIPRDPARALALLDHGRRLRIDLGEATLGDAEPRRFFLVCSAGIDARVVELVETQTRLKRWLGRFSFIAVGAAAIGGLRATPADVAVDAHASHPALLMAVLSNTRLYGGMVPLAREARADDGLLDVITFSDWRPAARFRHARYATLVLRSLLGRLDTPAGRGIDYRLGERIVIRPEARLAVEADGEFLGHCGPDAPLRVRVLPRALSVIVGPGPNAVLGDE